MYQDHYLIYYENDKMSKMWKKSFLKIMKSLVKKIKMDKTFLKSALLIESIRSSKKNGYVTIIPYGTRAGYTVPKQFVVTKNGIGNRKIRKHTFSRNNFMTLLKILED